MLKSFWRTRVNAASAKRAEKPETKNTITGKKTFLWVVRAGEACSFAQMLRFLFVFIFLWNHSFPLRHLRCLSNLRFPSTCTWYERKRESLTVFLWRVHSLLHFFFIFVFILCTGLSGILVPFLPPLIFSSKPLNHKQSPVALVEWSYGLQLKRSIRWLW